jgi:hypothetical protein
VVGSCKHGDKLTGSNAMEVVSYATYSYHCTIKIKKTSLVTTIRQCLSL